MIENRALYGEKYAVADRVFGNVAGYASPEAGFFLVVARGRRRSGGIESLERDGRACAARSLFGQDVDGTNPGQNIYQGRHGGPKSRNDTRVGSHP